MGEDPNAIRDEILTPAGAGDTIMRSAGAGRREVARKDNVAGKVIPSRSTSARRTEGV
jgi:hypothetical protein